MIREFFSKQANDIDSWGELSTILTLNWILIPCPTGVVVLAAQQSLSFSNTAFVVQVNMTNQPLWGVDERK